jgi:hypothetical protein
LYKQGKHGIHGFYTSEIASATARQAFYVMPQVRIRAFDIMRVFFIRDVSFALASEQYVHVNGVPVCVALIGGRHSVGYLLYCLCVRRLIYAEPDNLPRYSACHSHYITIYPHFMPFPLADIPKNPIKFKRRVVSPFTCPHPFGFFLSNTIRCSRSSHVSCLPLDRSRQTCILLSPIDVGRRGTPAAWGLTCIYICIRNTNIFAFLNGYTPHSSVLFPHFGRTFSSFFSIPLLYHIFALGRYLRTPEIMSETCVKITKSP